MNCTASPEATPLRISLLLVLLWVASILVRWPAFNQQSALQGLEATYHMLWTARVFESAPLESHWFLPSVTLDPDPEDPIRWGATVPTSAGSFIYTSFPPLGFLIAFLIALWVEQVDRFMLLGLANSLVGLIAAILLARLVTAVFQALRPDQESRRSTVFLTTFTLYLFSREALLSHGAVFWGHSISQLCLFAGLLSWWRVLQGDGGKRSVAGLVVIAFIYPSLEWTGFVFNAGIVFLSLATLLKETPDRYLLHVCGGVIVSTIAAGALLVGHFIISIGIDPLRSALMSRASARGGTFDALSSLPIDYVISFGLAAPIGLVCLLKILRGGTREPHSPYRLLLLASLFPMLANILLAQHAHLFSFDRLKLAAPLAIAIIGVVATTRIERCRALFLGGVALTLVSNVGLYLYEQERKRPWQDIIARNDAATAALQSEPLSTCALTGTAAVPRGNANLMLAVDIVAVSETDELLARARRRGSCAVVLVDFSSPYKDLHQIEAIDLYSLDGQPMRTIFPTR
ncbi:hypothetical protein WJT74_11655 [Sphingomicrobium sp. XHP0239]|uniref:hypothetical protein n=1 Tax=Sphingomicrobium maritimum TaxID=3133972 RepID=UPI0031CCA0FC